MNQKAKNEKNLYLKVTYQLHGAVNTESFLILLQLVLKILASLAHRFLGLELTSNISKIGKKNTLFKAELNKCMPNFPILAIRILH